MCLPHQPWAVVSWQILLTYLYQTPEGFLKERKKEGEREGKKEGEGEDERKERWREGGGGGRMKGEAWGGGMKGETWREGGREE